MREINDFRKINKHRMKSFIKWFKQDMENAGILRNRGYNYQYRKVFKLRLDGKIEESKSLFSEILEGLRDNANYWVANFGYIIKENDKKYGKGLINEYLYNVIILKRC